MILHVDMDAFYAAVECRDHPALQGRAVIVGGSPRGRGVVMAASYAARAFGVRSAMPAARARRLCPQAVFVRPRMAHYARESARIRTILERYTPLVEPLSLDEAFLDVAASERLFGGAERIARRIRHDVARERGLVASVGVARCKFLAKLASDLDKPDGLVVVAPGGEQAFLDPLPVARLWGVGRVTGEALRGLGITTLGELRRTPLERLQARFGRTGGHLWRLARGIDARPVVPDTRARSLSHETTFEVDLADREALRAWLAALAEQVGARLRRGGLCGDTVRVKVRFTDFETLTRARTLTGPTHATREIRAAAQGLLEAALGGAARPVRLLGVGVSGLRGAGPSQGLLFGERRRAREARLDALLDSVHERFGNAALRRGAGPPPAR